MTNTTDSRELALDILLEILEKDGYSHVVLGQALDKYQFLEKQERAFISRIVNGTLEYLIQLDAVIDRYSRTKVKKMKPLIRTLLRMSVYQLIYMDRVPDAAVCNEAVKLARKRRFQGLSGFVNGVLRTISREKGSLVWESLSERYSVPEWMIGLWRESYPDEVIEQMLEAFLTDHKTSVRINYSRADKTAVMESLRRQGVTVEESPLSDRMLLLSDYDYLDRLEAFADGWIMVQDISSSLAGDAASPAAGDYVIDVCAAPGGKSLHIADRMAGSGCVVARDISDAKVWLIEENIRRAGCTNVRAEVWDALKFDEMSCEKADIVVADLPCSGLGIIGKKPDIKYRMTPDKVQELTLLQRDILSVVWRYVKPGGVLVYSTCTINPQENEEQFRWFLEHYPFSPVNLEGRISLAEPSMQDGYVQLLPGMHPCDGFFIGVARRNDGPV